MEHVRYIQYRQQLGTMNMDKSLAFYSLSHQQVNIYSICYIYIYIYLYIYIEIVLYILYRYTISKYMHV